MFNSATPLILILIEDKVIAVDHFISATVAQESFYFTAFVTDDPARVIRRIGGQSASQCVSGPVLYDDQIAALENSELPGSPQAPWCGRRYAGEAGERPSFERT